MMTPYLRSDLSAQVGMPAQGSVHCGFDFLGIQAQLIPFGTGTTRGAFPMATREDVLSNGPVLWFAKTEVVLMFFWTEGRSKRRMFGIPFRILTQIHFSIFGRRRCSSCRRRTAAERFRAQPAGGERLGHSQQGVGGRMAPQKVAFWRCLGQLDSRVNLNK